MKLSKFISELKRRHVLKSTIAYLAIAWVVVQIASTVLPTFDAPDYTLKALFIVLSIGLVFWVAFSWIYDLTPEGIQKTDEFIEDEETVKLANQRLNKIIAASLVLAVILLVLGSFWAGSSWDDDLTPENKKVAVIPFVQQVDGLEEEGEEEEYFKIGMTDALINELSKVDQLTVIKRSSTQILSSGFHPNNSLISNVISGIDYFVDGVVERQLNEIKVHIKLKKNIDAEPIWQKNYTKDLSEVRPLWAEIAADLARQMSVVVKPEDMVLWSGLRPVKPETYELYLKGKHYMNQSTVDEWQRGLVYMEEAMNQNPSDPYAYAYLAEAYVSLGHAPNSPPDVFPKALAAANRAINLDSTVALGWAALSHYHTYFGRDWAMAEYAFERANELNPNLAYNHYHRAWYLFLFGRMNEAIEEHKRAQELDPFIPRHTAWLGELYRWLGLYEEGLAEVEKASQMEDGYALSMLIKGKIFLDQGKVEEGLEILRQAGEINSGWKFFGYGPALIRTGHIEEGRAVLEELEAMPLTGFRALCLGIMYAELDDFDKAFEYLNYDKKHGWHPWLRVMFLKGEIKKDPRFLKIIRDMNLPDPSPLVYYPELS
jgi:tetratricopeptide (TPR) repeat protein